MKTLQRAFKNDKENQAYAVDLLFGYMEDKDDPGYQNWRLLIRKVFCYQSYGLRRPISKKNWVDQSEIRMKTCISELDVMIKEPENYEIYKLIFEIINPNQIRAISTDTRMVFHRDHSSSC